MEVITIHVHDRHREILAHRPPRAPHRISAVSIQGDTIVIQRVAQMQHFLKKSHHNHRKRKRKSAASSRLFEKVKKIDTRRHRNTKASTDCHHCLISKPFKNFLLEFHFNKLMQMHQQSGKVTLESKEKLPSKLYDVVCDANLLVSHIQAASGSNEMLGTATKQFVAQENTIECTAQAIDRLNKLVDDLDDALPFPSEM
ncbi:unnamed protein product, partial [Mesorhabditis belari]|uniref:BLOC-1-related complex subunit 7 n=1 Tax=Mesorhabditis belari TaxID=2138241 RepID=A0AAF3FC76_9BILA